ncbi:hypothetical protein Droror1_Dr00015551 [Drosera rotundifolia]
MATKLNTLIELGCTVNVSRYSDTLFKVLSDPSASVNIGTRTYLASFNTSGCSSTPGSCRIYYPLSQPHLLPLFPAASPLRRPKNRASNPPRRAAGKDAEHQSATPCMGFDGKPRVSPGNEGLDTGNDSPH